MPLISDAEVFEDRAMAEAEMVDRCRITRRSASKGDFNPDTGQYDTPEPVLVYEGRMKVQVRADINSNAVEAVVAEHEWTYRTATFIFPMFAGVDATGRPDLGDPSRIRSDDMCEIVESPYDASRVGMVINLTADTKAKTWATSRKFRTKELLS